MTQNIHYKLYPELNIASKPEFIMITALRVVCYLLSSNFPLLGSHGFVFVMAAALRVM